MTEEKENGRGQVKNASPRLIRLTIDMEIEVIEALDKLRQEMGMRSRGALLNQLLREILINEVKQDQYRGN